MSGRPSKRSRIADDVEDDDDTFAFKYNEDGELVGTADEEAADRAYLNSLKEVERYGVILQREEERNNAKDKWEFLRKKQQEEAAKAAASTSRRRAAGAADARQKKALEKLQANRKRQQARTTSKQPNLDDDEYDDLDEDDDDDDDEDDIDDDEYDEYMEAATRSAGRGRGKGRRSAAAAAAADDDDDFGMPEEDEEEEDAAEATLDEIQQIRLSRHKLEKWCHEPFFDDLVEGCFVRITIGTSNETGQSVYRCAEIVNVEDRQSYSFGKTRTRKALKLRHGDQERNFRMEFVSNAKIEPSEFRKWQEAMVDNDLRPATRGHVERKLKALEEARNFKHTTNHVRKIVEEKQKAGASVGNSTIRVSVLEMQIAEKDELLKQMAAEERDPMEMGQVYEERKTLINERDMIKRKAEELRSDRQASYSKINSVNERNRARNMMTKKHQKSQDPLSDRRTRAPMVVSLQTGEVAEAAKKKAEDAAALQAAKEASKVAAEAAAAEATKFRPRRNSAKALQEAHESLQINIDVPLDLEAIPSLPLAASATRPKVPQPRKGLGFLAAYKRSNGLI
mmetsp:Transcript_20384/g.60889  ORF Transcript_20384/g.60889 Transcript_20384/m.60889 type:complete len:567 (-) Transcript_20384:8-1708(-)